MTIHSLHAVHDYLQTSNKFKLPLISQEGRPRWPPTQQHRRGRAQSGTDAQAQFSGSLAQGRNHWIKISAPSRHRHASKMRGNTLLVFLVAVLCFAYSIEAKETHRKHKKAHDSEQKKHIQEIEQKLDQLLQLEEEIESEMDNELDDPEAEANERRWAAEDEAELPEEEQDPCLKMYCGAGRECQISEDGEGVCQCVPECGGDLDERRMVCSSKNTTWNNDCELYRQRCQCADGLPGCLDDDNEHLHIDYYGHCQDQKECDVEELNDFPRRMREWLFNIMRDMADRELLSQHYINMEKEAETDQNKKWTNAVVWKFCELDGHPRDSSVSRHELFPLRAPLFTLEHCISEFLDSCDPDNDHNITMKEWASCLKLSEDNLDDLEDLCEDIRDEE